MKTLYAQKTKTGCDGWLFVEESHEHNKPRNESRRLSSSEAHRRCRRVAPQQPPPGWQSDLSPVEEERARCIRGESAHADFSRRLLLSEPAINPGRGRRSGD